jgi:ankyrin repeat protein
MRGTPIASCFWAVVLILAVARVAAAAGEARLADAAQRRDQAAVRALLKQHVDVNAPQADGATALAWAAHWDDLDTANLLIRTGANVNAADDQGVTPLALACANGRSAMVERLLAAGANANATRSTGETPLMTAAHTGNVDVVKALLGHGADVNANKTESKQTPLMWAVSERHSEIVGVLVEAGADVRARSAGGFTPLLFAARQGDTLSARLLLDAGADVNERARDGGSALVVAAASGREDAAILLVERGADPNADGSGYTALHAAVPKDLRRLVKTLLTRRANPNVGLKKAPPSIFGPSRGAGSEVMAETGSGAGGGNSSSGPLAGATPFWLAARSVNVEIMELLVEGGADRSSTTVNGTTPLMAAAGITQIQGPRAKRGDVSAFYSNWGEHDSLDAVRFLVQHGADVTATNEAGQTALHGAAYMGGNPIVQFLVEHGARINGQDAQGQTPFRIAEGHLNVASQGVTSWPKTSALLGELGADITLGVDGRTMLRRYGNLGVSAPETKSDGSRPR